MTSPDATPLDDLPPGDHRRAHDDPAPAPRPIRNLITMIRTPHRCYMPARTRPSQTERRMRARMSPRIRGVEWANGCARWT